MEQFLSAFDEEANFCAGATRIHTHSATCVKYSLSKPMRKGGLCRFRAPWKLVERTAFTEEGVLKIRRTHPLVNRWNKAIAVGLRHNHDISFIATQQKTMALIYYVTNYSTKVGDPIWKRAVTAAELLPASAADGGSMTGEGDGAEEDRRPIEGANENRTRQFLMKVANCVFTERPLSQVEVIAYLLGYPAEFSNTNESIVVEEAGHRLGHVEAYQHRGEHLRDLCLYDYVSIVRLKRRSGSNEGAAVAWGEVPFQDSWPPGKGWMQVLRRPGKQATVCLDGYLSKDFSKAEEDEGCYGSGLCRAGVQHLALFVPWEKFFCEEAGDINDVWMRARGALPPRISCLVENVQLLRRSAEDAKRDAKQWAASAGDGDAMVGHMEEGEAGEATAGAYEPSKIGDATRLMDVVRNALGPGQVTAGSAELRAVTRQLCRFQQSALSSTAELEATAVSERGLRQSVLPGHAFSGATVPSQDQVKAIKGQQKSASRERERMIQGIQCASAAAGSDRRAGLRAVMSGFGEDDIEVSAAELDEIQGRQPEGHAGAEMQLQFGPSASFLAAGKEWARRLTLNEKQSIAFLIVCRQLDHLRGGRAVDADQLCHTAISWDVDSSFKAEQRHQHDKAHALWRRFTTVIMLDEQMRAAGDAELQTFKYPPCPFVLWPARKRQ
ncbi:ATP-dependent DNA helicase PIF1 [Purpureocillium lilacinum]|uniref:ATP-dependent DNA helicase PIF1 n=1 Tax=Purpureocillium lilacinum TaxID=33203 RepID=A0A179FBR2_PURLI|nr:ATP-dependent DNA helicase PIF1 [Purpureocillium lilacinum]